MESHRPRESYDIYVHGELATICYPQEENLAVRVTLFICTHYFETIGHLICECLTPRLFFLSHLSLHLITTRFFNFKEGMLEQACSLSSDKFARLLMFIWSLWKNKNEQLWNEAAQPSPVIVSLTMA